MLIGQWSVVDSYFLSEYMCEPWNLPEFPNYSE